MELTAYKVLLLQGVTYKLVYISPFLGPSSLRTAENIQNPPYNPPKPKKKRKTKKKKEIGAKCTILFTALHPQAIVLYFSIYQ